jgi:hypothetical protein
MGSLTAIRPGSSAGNANTSGPGWGQVVTFAACPAARIGEVSGVRRADIDTGTWIWTVRRQTTPGPGGLIDKATKASGHERCQPLKKAASWLPVASTASAQIQVPGCSLAPEAGGPLPPSCAMRRTGTRWSPASDMSTCGGTICGMPGSPGWRRLTAHLSVRRSQEVPSCGSCGDGWSLAES